MAQKISTMDQWHQAIRDVRELVGGLADDEGADKSRPTQDEDQAMYEELRKPKYAHILKAYIAMHYLHGNVPKGMSPVDALTQYVNTHEERRDKQVTHGKAKRSYPNARGFRK